MRQVSKAKALLDSRTMLFKSAPKVTVPGLWHKQLHVKQLSTLFSTANFAFIFII